MNVLYFLPRPLALAFGGQEVQLLQTAAALRPLGVQVRYADYFDRDLLRGIDLVHLFGSDHVYAQLVKLLRARGLPYVVSSVFYPVGRDRQAQALLAQVPYSQSWLRGQVLRHAAAVLPNSRAEQDLLKGMFGLEDRAFTVVPNGVDPMFVGRDPDAFRAHLPPGWPDGTPFLLSVGRIERRKNSLLLLRAAARLRVPVVFIGAPVEAEREYTDTFFRELHTYPGHAAHLTGFPPGSDTLANAYAAAHAHALLSDLETPGLANLEAALNGANLVVGDALPVREYLESAATLVNPHHLDDVVTALHTALERPRNALGQRERVAGRYTWARVAGQTAQVYRRVLGEA
ncbi:glycosyltransferase family 4 protein [Deinococcus apachensis]|uniref:glycosyltransferase family 4 protein n=1 Tax=Deinococcus apachensis TaxID=309886 RepID=UPI00035C5273|nr:glycosyltransferase family 4 protein [Deinococcus apachensis]